MRKPACLEPECRRLLNANSRFAYSRLKRALRVGFIKRARTLRFMNTTRRSIPTAFPFSLIVNNTGCDVTESVTTFVYFRALRKQRVSRQSLKR
jgi:hypothetical protein